MKANEAIATADTLCPNPFSTAQKLRELNQIEYRIRVDVLGEDPEEVLPITEEELDTTELTLEDRYTDVYVCWLKSRYYWLMGEYDVYQNEKAMFEAEWNRWAADVCQTMYEGSCGGEY